MIAGRNVGLSRMPKKISAAMTPAMIAPGTPHGLRYGRFAFGYLRRRITNATICSRYASTAPHTAMFSTIAPATAPAPSASTAASTSSTMSAAKPITAPATSATHGVCRLPVSERNFG